MDKEQVNQPTPVFTLLDLEAKLTTILNKGLFWLRSRPNEADRLREINGDIQELLAIIIKTKNDLGSIEMPIETAQAITQTINTEKPEFSVCGVQLIENGTLVGTFLYSTVIKARKI